jgi:hypothetical protein
MGLPQPGSGSGSRIYILQEQGGPVIPPGTGFDYCLVGHYVIYTGKELPAGRRIMAAPIFMVFRKFVSIFVTFLCFKIGLDHNLLQSMSVVGMIIPYEIDSRCNACLGFR